MHQAGALTAYVHAMLNRHGAIIAGSFHFSDNEVTYRGDLFVGGHRLTIRKDALNLYLQIADHVVQGLSGARLSSIVQLPQSGDEAIDRAIMALVIANAENSSDDRDNPVLCLALCKTSTLFDLDFNRKTTLYTGNPL